MVFLSRFVTPSPGAYNPQSADKETRKSEPMFSFGIKPDTKKGPHCPGEINDKWNSPKLWSLKVVVFLLQLPTYENIIFVAPVNNEHLFQGQMHTLLMSSKKHPSIGLNIFYLIPFDLLNR